MLARGIGGIVLFVVACASSPTPHSASGSGSQSTPGASQPTDPLDQPTPLFAEVRRATLPNGLTFYVRRHEKPEHRAALWLAVDAGSVLEADDQRGLAHFVEHMAFQGTKRFPKKAIVDFIERSGMVMGADVNAYTSTDQTVYMFTVPTDDEATMFQGLDVLYDIAGSVTFDPAEVDLERPVILEEWRLRRGAGRRMFEQQVPFLFAGSRYAERLPIGLPATIRTAPLEKLRKFYDDFYRPESMAVIAIGDFDPARMENEIRRRFVGLRGSSKRRTRSFVPVPHAHPVSVAVASDPELRSSYIHVFDKVDPHPKRTKRDYQTQLVERLYLQIMTGRLSELRDEPERPFVSADIERRRMSRSLDAITYSIKAKDGRIEEALKLLFGEIERAGKYGFSLTETVRAQKMILARAEAWFSEADKVPPDSRARELVRNFLEDEEVPGAELELEWTRELVPGITLNELAALAKQRSGDAGRVIAVATPGKVSPPTAMRVQAIVADARREDLGRWQDKTVDEPLMDSRPKPGRVVGTARDAAADATLWTLANGVRVVVKPTAFRNASIVLRGFQPGGTSLVSDADFGQVRFADEIVSESGAGNFSEFKLRRLLAGNSASVSVELGELGAIVDARARTADLETMLGLVYLRLAQPRVHTNAFQVWKDRRLDAVRRRADSPEQAFNDEIAVLLSRDHPRRRPASVESIERVDMEKSFKLWQERFADLGGFTFVIVGNFDVLALKPLVETYLGGLPSRPTHESWKDPKIPYPTGQVEKTIRLGSEPRSRVMLAFVGPAAWGLDATRDARILEAVLELRLVEVLREKLGGTYTVSVDADFQREPTERRRLEVGFSCAPENVDKLTAAVLDELRAIAKAGVGEEYLAKVRHRLSRLRETSRKENAWWADWLLYAYRYGDDFGMITDIEATVRRATPENVRAIAARMFDEKNYVRAVLLPASSPNPAGAREPGQVSRFPDAAP